MSGVRTGFLDRLLHKRTLRRWGEAADAAGGTDLETLRSLRAITAR